MRASTDNGSSGTDSQTPDRRTMRRAFNLRLVVGTLIVLAVLAPAAYCWHAYQLDRATESLLDQADRLAREEDFKNAAEYLNRYLRVHPDEADVRVRLAETFDKSAQDPGAKWRAKDLYFEALAVASEEKKPALQRRLASLLVELGRWDPSCFTLAGAEAERLLKKDPAEADARRLLALADEGQLRSGTLERHQQVVPKPERKTAKHVVIELEMALTPKENQGDVELSEALARAYRNEQVLPAHEFRAILGGIWQPQEGSGEEDADQKEQDEKPLDEEGLSGIRQRLARADEKPLPPEFSKLLPSPEPATSRVNGEGEGSKGPQGPLSFLVAAVFARAPGGPPKRPATSVKPVELMPQQRQALVSFVRARLADDVIDQMVSADPTSPDSVVARYSYRKEYGVADPAEGLPAVREKAPDHVGVLLVAGDHAQLLAELAQRRGAPADEVAEHLADARKCYEHAIEVAPSDFRAYLELGDVHYAQRELGQALQTWRSGLASIRGNVPRAEFTLNSCLAQVLIDLGRLEEAWDPEPAGQEERAEAQTLPIGQCEVALRGLTLTEPRAEMLPRERNLRLLQAKWFIQKRDYRKAIPLLEALAAGQQPGRKELGQAFQALSLLSSIHASRAEWVSAARSWEQAASLRPSAPEPRLQAAEAWKRAGRPDVAAEQFRLALAVADNVNVRFRLAQTELEAQLRRSQGERSWEKFHTVLAELRQPEWIKQLSDPWRLSFLEAQFELSQATENSPDADSGDEPSPAAQAAKKCLDDAAKEYPDSAKLFAVLVSAYEHVGYSKDADNALATYRKMTEGSAAGYLLASYLYRMRDQYDQARAVVQEGIRDLPSEFHLVLQLEACGISTAENQLERGQRELGELHKAHPAHVGIMWLLADLALRTNNLSDLKQWETELRIQWTKDRQEPKGSDGGDTAASDG